MLILIGASNAVSADDRQSAPLSPCEACAKDGWPVALSPGPIRIALPSPDGSMLAVLGGPGVPGRDHTVLVVGAACDSQPGWVLELSNGARWIEITEEIPVPLVRLAWSEDSKYLFAAGDVYQLTPTEFGISGKRLRSFDNPMLDFRFRQGRAAMVEFLSGDIRQTRADGQENYTAHINYQLARLTREVNIPVSPREERAGLWTPNEMEGVPAVGWEDDGALLMYTPFESVTERFIPRKVREKVDIRIPARPMAGEGPFEAAEGCSGYWDLNISNKSDRVVWKTN